MSRLARRRACRVGMWRDVTQQVEFGLYGAIGAPRPVGKVSNTVLDTNEKTNKFTG